MNILTYNTFAAWLIKSSFLLAGARRKLSRLKKKLKFLSDPICGIIGIYYRGENLYIAKTLYFHNVGKRIRTKIINLLKSIPIGNRNE